METRFYTTNDITTWATDLKETPGIIKNKEDKKAEASQRLTTLREELAAVEVKIKPLDKEINAIHAQLQILKIRSDIALEKAKIPYHQQEENRLSIECTRLNHQITKQQTEVRHAQRVVDAKNILLRIANLESQIPQDQKQSAELSNQLERLNNQLTAKETQIKTKQAFVKSFETIIEDAKTHFHGMLGQHQQSLEEFIQRKIAAHFPGMSQQMLDSAKSELEQLTHERARLDSQKSIIDSQSDSLNEKLRAESSELANKKRQLQDYSFHEKDNANNHDLHFLERNLSDLKFREHHLREQHRSLEQHLHYQQNALGQIHQKINELENEITRLQTIATVYLGNTDTSDLNRQLTVFETQIAPHINERNLLQIEIAIKESYIRNEATELRQLRDYLHELQSNQFMFNLRDNPQILCQNLAQKITDQLRQYEIDHEVNQSIAVRLALVEIEARFKEIYIIEPGNLDQNRKVYYQICGLLWQIQHRLGQEEENQSLIRTIQSCFSPSSVDAQESLIEYSALNLPQMTEADLDQYEMQQYHSAEQELNRSLSRIPVEQHPTLQNLHDKCVSLRDHTHAKINVTNEQNLPKPNVKFYTTALRKTAQLVENYANKDIRDDYQAFADKAEGTPSVCKIVAGAICMVVGAVGFVLSALVTITNTLGILGIAASATLFGLGVKLARDGQRIGTSKKMTDIKDAANKAASATSRQGYQAIPSTTEPLNPDLDVTATLPYQLPQPSAPSPRG